MASKLVSLFICSFFALISAQTKEDPVLHLSQNNFTSTVSGKDFIVLFFSPYCIHCQHFKPAWQDFASQVKGNIGVGAVDCTKESFLEDQFSIHGYPTVFLLRHGKKYQFGGPRTVDGLNEFIKDGYLKSPASDLPSFLGSAAGGAKPETKKTDLSQLIEAFKAKNMTVNATTKSSNPNKTWLRLIVVGTVLLGLVMILLFRAYVKRYNDSVRLESVAVEEDVAEDTEEDVTEDTGEDITEDTEDSSNHDSSIILDKPTMEVEIADSI